MVLGGALLALVITGTTSLIWHSHGSSRSLQHLMHLPSQLPFLLSLVQQEELTASFLISGEMHSTCVWFTCVYRNSKSLVSKYPVNYFFPFPFLETGSCVWLRTTLSVFLRLKRCLEWGTVRSGEGFFTFSFAGAIGHHLLGCLDLSSLSPRLGG